MEASRSKRIVIRLIVMTVVTVLLAFLPILFLEQPITDSFSPLQKAQTLAKAYISRTKICHILGITAVFLVNLGFFLVNEKKNDSGLRLHKRCTGQNWCNMVVILGGLGAMIGVRFGLISESFIQLGYIPVNFLILLSVWLPYIVFVTSALLLWSCCMRVTPATNCYLASWSARKIDGLLVKKSEKDN